MTLRLFVCIVTLPILSLHSVFAAEVDLKGRFIEGGLVIGKTYPDNKISLDDVPLIVSKDGDFVFGFHRKAPDRQTLHVTLPDGSSHKQVLEISSRTYDVQRIDGLDEKWITPPSNVAKRIRADAAKVSAVRRSTQTTMYFGESWIWPAQGIISGVYGSRRVLNGKPRAPHYGIDISVTEGALVRAPASGTITLVEDLYYSGITVMIDHGMGIMSTMLHLQESLVKVGDQVSQGDVIARSGNTGRSSGAHLDWRINWLNHARLDPGLLVPLMQ
ncbi:MAG: M23 family metallopeptidase [Alphaproteobacteria bacterium]|nr:M23 family metallopeptidase [Alphaproteobacteria bacterium]